MMIQDAPHTLASRSAPAVIERVGAAAENARLVKLEAGPAG